MLYVIIGKAKAAGTRKERVARRVQWQYPPGVRMTAEYWLMSEDPTLIAVAEAEDAAPIMMGISDWDDFLDITVIPALPAEQGLDLARRMQTGSST